MNLNVKRIAISLTTIGALSAAVFAGTGAFFSDTETSTGNILQAGALDLKIDNTCYYNGFACTEGTWAGGEFEGDECSCTWTSTDLGEGNVLFDLRDLKPGDWEEDTLSFEVDNPSWLCVDLRISENSDNDITEPEDEAGPPSDDGLDGTPDGDLAEELNFIFWNDDGDNVLEVGENVLTTGPASNVLDGVRWPIADASTEGGPIPSERTTYIGKAFCYGDLEASPLAQGDYPGPGTDNDDDEDVDPQDGGILCDGSLVGNLSQTDSLGGDVVFYAEQARHNEEFLCNPPEPTPTSEPTPTATDTPTPTPTNGAT